MVKIRKLSTLNKKTKALDVRLHLVLELGARTALSCGGALSCLSGACKCCWGSLL